MLHLGALVAVPRCVFGDLHEDPLKIGGHIYCFIGALSCPFDSQAMRNEYEAGHLMELNLSEDICCKIFVALTTFKICGKQLQQASILNQR